MKWTVARLVAELRDRCQRFRAVIGEQSLATDAELEAYWPGGDENAQTDVWGWAYAYAQYSRLLGRMEQRDAPDERQEADAGRALRDIVRSAPVIVELDARDEMGLARTLAIHPKSYHANCCITHWGNVVMRAHALYHALASTHSYGPLAEHGAAVMEAASYYERLIVWSLHHAGAGLPFPDGEPPPLPAWTADLTALDFVRVVQAHQLVNGGRLAIALKRRSAQGGDDQRSSWATLLAVGAKELGVTLHAASREIALESIVAQLATIREVERAAAAQRPARGAADLPDML